MEHSERNSPGHEPVTCLSLVIVASGANEGFEVNIRAGMGQAAVRNLERPEGCIPGTDVAASLRCQDTRQFDDDRRLEKRCTDELNKRGAIPKVMEPANTGT